MHIYTDSIIMSFVVLHGSGRGSVLIVTLWLVDFLCSIMGNVVFPPEITLLCIII